MAGPTIVVLGIFGAGLVVCLFYAVGVFNNLVEVRNNVDKAFKNIDVILMQRQDEVVKLVDVCKQYMKHERELLNEVTKLRVDYRDARNPDEKIDIENKMMWEVQKLGPVWEGYPDLKASQNFIQLQQRISELEDTISDRREFYNECVNIYNVRIESIPDRFLARGLGYGRKNLLEVPDAKKQDMPKVFAQS